MKIVIFGFSMSSTWGNEHASFWRGLCRSLCKRGHEVVFFERDLAIHASHRDFTCFTEYPSFALILYSTWTEVTSLAKKHLSESDIGIVTSFCPDGVLASEMVLNSPLRVRIFYDLDTATTLSKNKQSHSLEYLPKNGLGDFDLVLSTTGGLALQKLKAQLNAQQVFALYSGVDTATYGSYQKGQNTNTYKSHLSYLGSYSADRQTALSQLFIQSALKLRNHRFLICGSQFPEGIHWPENVVRIQNLLTHEHPSFYESSKLTLNITRAPLSSWGYCPSTQLFEAVSCGTPILSDYWEGIEQFFIPGKEILIARTSEEAVDSIQRSDAELTEIAQRAQEKVLTLHTFDHRARELEYLLEQSDSPKKNKATVWGVLPTQESTSGSDDRSEITIEYLKEKMTEAGATKILSFDTIMQVLPLIEPTDAVMMGFPELKMPGVVFRQIIENQKT